MKLVNEYAELKREMKELEAKKKKLKEAIIEHAKKEGVTRLGGLKTSST